MIIFSIPTSADYEPGEIEILPSKDTYLNPFKDVNYGGGQDLEIGSYGFGTYSIAIIQFDMTQITKNIDFLPFRCDITAYDDDTRKIKVDIVPDIDWDELEITGRNDPLNTSDFFFGNEENATFVLTITGSSEDIELNLIEYQSVSLLNLVFSGDITDDVMAQIPSKENRFLGNEEYYDKPPRLAFADPTDTSEESETDIARYNFLGIGIIFIGTLIRKGNYDKHKRCIFS